MALTRFRGPLQSLVVGVGVVSHGPLYGSFLRPFSATATSAARCEEAQLRISAIPRAPTSAVLNPDAARLFNTTKAEVLEDLAEDRLIPPEIDLKDQTKWKCQLFQFESCPFCRKVRVCLDFLDIPYEVVETHPLSKKELKPITDYRKVPVLVITKRDHPSERFILTDSKRIVHSLMVHEKFATSTNEREKKQSEISWIKWSDDVLVQLIVVNIYRSIKESAETFAYLLTHPSYTWFEKYSAQISGTLIMWLVSKRRKSKYQIKDERNALYTAIEEFLTSKGSNRFHGGETPNEADINVYGIMKSIEGFSCEQDVLKNTRIGEWMNHMKSQRGESTAANTIQRGPQHGH